MISELVKNIEPFYVMDILEKAKQLESEGEDIVHFEVGEPDFNTPEEIRAEAVRWIEKGYTQYTSSLGIDELRGLVAEDYARTSRPSHYVRWRTETMSRVPESTRSTTRGRSRSTSRS